MNGRKLGAQVALVTLVLLFTLTAPVVNAQDRDDGGAPRQAEDSEGGNESLTVVELSQLCRHLAADDQSLRVASAQRIIASGPSSVQTIRHRLKRDLRSAPGDIEKLLNRLSPDVRGSRLPPQGKVPPFDLLEPLLSEPREGEAGRAIVEATEVVTLLRALLEVESTSATRSIIQYGARERGVFKAEVARNTLRLGDKALPALVLTTQHPREPVAKLAADLLEWLGHTTRGRQVQVRDPGTLAEILSVYGELSDRDTIPVLLSFSGSEKAAVREAARASLLRYGTAILWPARTRYENFTGEEPSRRWGWEELARRLFESQDRARTAQAEQAMADGLRLAKQGDHSGMLDRYHRILSRWPDYERQSEMIPGILSYADALDEQGESSKAMHLRAQALLLDAPTSTASALESKLILHSVEIGLERGIVDQESLSRLSEQGHDNARAEEIIAHVDDRIERPSPESFRLIASVGLAILGLTLLGILVFRLLSSTKDEAIQS